MFVTVAKISK